VSLSFHGVLVLAAISCQVGCSPGTGTPRVPAPPRVVAAPAQSPTTLVADAALPPTPGTPGVGVDADTLPETPEPHQRYATVLDALDADHVRYVVGSGVAFYLETDARWLCLRLRESGFQPLARKCWTWPANLPRVLHVNDPEYDDDGAIKGVTVMLKDKALDLGATWTPNEDAPSVAVAGARGVPGYGTVRPPDSLRSPPFKAPPKGQSKGLPFDKNPFLRMTDVERGAVAHAIDAIAERGPALDIECAEYAGTSLISFAEKDTQEGRRKTEVTDFNEEDTCQRRPGTARACGGNLHGFVAASPAKTQPAGWLVMVEGEGDVGGNAKLVWVIVSDGSLKTFEMPVAASGGDGMACQSGGLPGVPANATGYCMDFQGFWTPFEILSPTCVRIGKTTVWRTIHIRTGDRWVQESHDAAPTEIPSMGLTKPAPTPGTYRPGAGGWEAVQCSVRP
jgi:hypothetical protein